jgi:hypothetical protein
MKEDIYCSYLSSKAKQSIRYIIKLLNLRGIIQFDYMIKSSKQYKPPIRLKQYKGFHNSYYKDKSSKVLQVSKRPNSIKKTN